MRFLILMCLLPLACFGFGSEGHRAIAEVAWARLPEVIRSKADAILAESPSQASTWPDEIRTGGHPGKLANTTEGKAFNKNHPKNREWHFVNLPLGTAAYTKDSAFASTNDIVHAISNCIDVLEGHSIMMSKREALRWIIHLVGDLHQPLHVACGYYAFEPSGKYKLVTNPLDCSGRDDDRGGNRLQYGKSSSLHAYWDTHMVDHLTSKRTGEDLNRIIASTASRMLYKNKGDYHQWPANWATESAAVARTIYGGLRLGKRTFTNDDWKIEVSLSKTYDDAYSQIAKAQLAKAAYNLAELLKTIKWK